MRPHPGVWLILPQIQMHNLLFHVHDGRFSKNDMVICLAVNGSGYSSMNGTDERFRRLEVKVHVVVYLHGWGQPVGCESEIVL